MSPETRESWEDREINLLDYWRVLRRHGGIILGLTFVSVFTAGFLSYFVITKTYESTATILAPRESGGGGGSLAAALSGSGLRQLIEGIAPSAGSNRDIFITILRSRTVAQEIVERYSLTEYFKTKYTEDAIKALQSVTEVKVSREGAISVTVTDKDPRLAADIANGYMSDLDRLFAKLGTTDASRQRGFIAERLEKTEKALRQGEDALRRFQENNKAIVMQEQARSGIEEAAKVKGQIVVEEAKLEFLRSYATETNPQVLQQRRQVEELKRQLGQMQYGQGMDLPFESGNSGQSRKDFQIAFTRVPQVGMELARLTRDVKVQETVFNLLTAQYEQAKIAEARDTPMVQVLDKAVPSERKSKPRTVLNMAIAGGLGLLIGMFLAFFLQYLDRLREQTRGNATI